MTRSSHNIPIVVALFLATFVPVADLRASEEPSASEVTVYRADGKKRVHVKGCKRLPADRKGFSAMTMAEAEEKSLLLCSRCPGSTTAGKKKE